MCAPLLETLSDAYETRRLFVRAALDQLDAALAEAEARHAAEAARQAIVEALRDGAFILCPPACPHDGCAVALF